MIKEYYIIVRNKYGKLYFEPRIGHIFTDKNGNKYGTLKEDGRYLIYELSTGMHADHCKYPAHTLNEIQCAIDSVADVVSKRLKEDDSFFDKCRAVIKEGYKSMEERYRGTQTVGEFRQVKNKR